MMPRKPKVTRRGKNEGSVYRRKDGKWVGQVTVGYRPDNGKPIRKYTYANTREEAARWVALTLTTELDKETHPLSEDLMPILDIGRNTAYELVRCGTIRSIRIGKQLRIPKQALIDYLSDDD